MRIPRHFFFQWKVSSLEELDEISHFIFLSREECEKDLRDYLIKLIDEELRHDDEDFDWDQELEEYCSSIAEQLVGVKLKDYKLDELKLVCKEMLGCLITVSTLEVKDAK